ncbi:hypothetical protein [Streptomyces sp. 5-10]|uniref:hypothetical protein n=1 Tax=Streptomyces sp. 5-10 TaxID=878925 RepID=UPI00168BD90F|nr:hypothetical protein [Streptomyces sp. 5-10]MBD3004584.1 hypothetical protein [Streptomyces sp. 5-10]
MSEMIVETSRDGRYRVRLEADQEPVNPRRDYDHLAHVITVPGSRYLDVDPDGGPLQEGWDRIKDRSDAPEVFARWAKIFHGAVIVEHTPHEGPRSLWYLLPEDIQEIGNTPEEALKTEIDEYQSWAEGDVWGFIVEKSVDWTRTDDEDETRTTWEMVDSCWGFIGYRYAEEAAREGFAAYLSA